MNKLQDMWKYIFSKYTLHNYLNTHLVICHYVYFSKLSIIIHLWDDDICVHSINSISEIDFLD